MSPSYCLRWLVKVSEPHPDRIKNHLDHLEKSLSVITSKAIPRFPRRRCWTTCVELRPGLTRSGRVRDLTPQRRRKVPSSGRTMQPATDKPTVDAAEVSCSDGMPSLALRRLRDLEC